LERGFSLVRENLRISWESSAARFAALSTRPATRPIPADQSDRRAVARPERAVRRVVAIVADDDGVERRAGREYDETQDDETGPHAV
jgi:hypothetical protein